MDTPEWDAHPLLDRRAALARLGIVAAGLHAPLTFGRRATAPVHRAGDADIALLLRLANVPSVSYAVIDGDRITSSAIGIRRSGGAEQVTPDTIYAAASLTKVVFSYTLLSLVHEGLFSLDRPVREYLPLPNPDDARAGAITARHLLSHSGGWRNWRNTPAQPLTADFEPGTRWSYSGEGFFFLQRIVEHLTAKSIGTLARERVFEPLGMQRSSMIGLESMEPFQATGHDTRGEVGAVYGRPALLELRRAMTARGLPLDAATVEDAERALTSAEPTLPALPNFLSPNAAASMLTTATDFARFLRHVVTARRSGGAPSAIVDHMMSPQIRCNEAIQWGLGVGLEDRGNRRFAWQWGDNPGFKNFYAADPQGAKAVVVFTNGDRGARVYERVIRMVAEEHQAAFLWA